MKPIANLKPLVKYQGGKSRELPLIKQLLPSQFTRVVEPFCGVFCILFATDSVTTVVESLNSFLIDL